MSLSFHASVADGRRTLDVYVDGPDTGTPLVFHNGTPSSGKLYAPMVDAAAARSLRMVGFSRAGYGDSTPNPGRSVADVAQDVMAVLDALGADQFYCLGWSGGGPHALACAALMRDRVIAAATVGGLAPHDADGLDWLSGMGQENEAAFRAALAGDDALQAVADQIHPLFSSMTPDEVATSLGDLVSEVDRAAISGESATWLAEVFRESVRNGMSGWVEDERALVTPWGFDVGEIALSVGVWQGLQDRFTPYPHGEWLASHIPGARAHLLSDQGHLSLGVNAFGLILDDLLHMRVP
jgi:pimeloyl-ACP methyl ester carboxylesterase